MSDIYNKIRKDKLFFTFIAITEISYFAILLGLLFLEEYPHSAMLYYFKASFLFLMIVVCLLFFVVSFFNSRIRAIRKEIVFFFLFRVSLITYFAFLIISLSDIRK